MTQKKVTITDIAKAAGVSKTTISRYLNGRFDLMSPETRRRIESVIDVSGYQPSTIARSLKNKRSLLLGIVAAAVGAVLLFQPALFQSILTVILGIYILIDGLLNLKRALELRRMEHMGWTLYLVLSLITVVLGLVVVFRPMLAGTTLVRLIGASLLYSGAADLWTLFQLSRWTKEYRKIHPVEVDPVDLD